MDRRIKSKLLKTAGWVTVGLGLYLVYRGNELDTTVPKDGIIDAKYVIIEE